MSNIKTKTMYDYTKELGSKLNDLLEKTYDAEKGYKKAADKASSPNLKRLFERRAQERYNFGHEIKSELSRIGHEPNKGGSTTGTLHRAWMDVESFFSSDNDESMLEAAITGEKAAVEEYNEVLSEGEPHIPNETSAILTRQHSIIKSELSRIKHLEDIVD